MKIFYKLSPYNPPEYLPIIEVHPLKNTAIVAFGLNSYILTKAAIHGFIPKITRKYNKIK